MKKKLLTFLLAIFMVVPVVGCGDPDLSATPDNDQAKILLDFAELGTEENTYKLSGTAAKLKNNYSDCAELQGAGFYDIGDAASIGLRYNAAACSFKGWVTVDGGNIVPVHASDTPFAYLIQNKDAGKTLTFYAVMGDTNETGSLNVKDTQYHISAISITKYTYDKVYALDGSDELTLDDGSKYRFEDTKFVNVSTHAESLILEGDNVMLGTAIYTVVRDQFGNVTGVAKGAVQNTKKTEDIDSSALVNYQFPTTGATPKTFQALKTKITSGTFKQQSKLAEVEPDVNFSYYMNSSGELQYYKVTWKYGLGKCDAVSPNTIFDPMSTVFPASAHICLSANIDLTQGITESFVKDAVTATFYNQAYVDTVSNSACMSATKGNSNVTDTCMYIKNIGALTDVPVNELTKLADSNTFYYALVEDSLGNDRLEGIEQSFSDLMYESYTYNTTDSNAYRTLYTSKDVSYMKGFNLRIGPVYEALLDALQTPSNQVSNLTFTYNKHSNSSVVESILVDGTRYYFNYVDSASDTQDYFPSPAPGDPPHAFLGKTFTDSDRYAISLLADNPVVADQDLLDKLIKMINDNPQNLMTNNAVILQSNLEELIFQLLNTKEELKNFKKYEVALEIDGGIHTINMVAKNKVLNIANFKNYKFAYNDIANLYVLKFNDDTNPTAFNASAYPTSIARMLGYVNVLLSNATIADSEELIKIKSDEENGYIDYYFYEALGAQSLKYRLRYHNSDVICFEAINIYTDMISDATFYLINETNSGSIGELTKITDQNYTLTTISNYQITKAQVESINTYTIKIKGKDYIIDLTNKEVYNVDENAYTKLVLNLAEDLKFYFELEEEEYYGIYYETPIGGDPKFVLYKVDVTIIGRDITHTKEAKIGDLVEESYLLLDGGYYPIEYDPTTQEGTLYVPVYGEEAVAPADAAVIVPEAPTIREIDFKFDGEPWSVDVTIQELVLKQGEAIITDYNLPIVEAFALIYTYKDAILTIEAPSDRYIIFHEGEIYEIMPDSSSSDYIFIYDDVAYYLTFE